MRDRGVVMSFYGADTQQVDEYSRTVLRGGERIAAVIDVADSRVQDMEWVGPDADAFRSRWAALCGQQIPAVLDLLRACAQEAAAHAEEQDRASDEGDGGAALRDRIGRWLQDYEALESDGFFGDLLGGPESGYWGSLAWNSLGIATDVLGFLPDPSGALTAVNLVPDVANVGIGLYDAGQAFQDGEYFGVADGLLTSGINGLDGAFGVVGLIPTPWTKAIGEVGGMLTGSLDIAWSAATIAAQASAISGGPGGGSTTQFLAHLPGLAFDAVTGSDALTDATSSAIDLADRGFGMVSETVREAVPIIDPILDLPQRLVEAPLASVAEGIEGAGEAANEWIREVVPW
jgi:hypothetical protein